SLARRFVEAYVAADAVAVEFAWQQVEHEEALHPTLSERLQPKQQAAFLVRWQDLRVGPC
ncbi:hypothetical protein pipiens_010659, partial [Culex pipiens pipiens]